MARHAWRIGQRQITLVAQRLGRLNLEFARTRITVEKQRLLVKIADGSRVSGGLVVMVVQYVLPPRMQR
jgi:hypothetical protein